MYTGENRVKENQMSTIDEKIARAKKAQHENRRYRDVPVTLDAGLSDEKFALEDEREQIHKERLARLNSDDHRLAHTPDTSDLDERLEQLNKRIAELSMEELDTLIIVRVYKLPGDLWAEVTVRHPMREGAQFDATHGYNIHAATKQVVESFGRLVENGEEKTLTEEQWAEIWPLLGGAEFGNIADAVYALNVLEPASRSARLKNSYEAALASNKK